MQAPSTLSSVFQDTLHSRSQFQRKSAHTRARCAGVHLAAVSFLVLLACLPSSAQEARWKQLNAQAAQLQDQGRYGEALPIAQEAARVAEATFGTNNEITAASLNRLGNILSDLGRYPDAEATLKRALAIGEKVLGPEHDGISTMLNNLASIYEDEGRYPEAEPLYKRSLAIDEKTLAPTDQKIGSDLNNLALLYAKQGRYAEAEPLYKRAQDIDEKALGPNNPHFAVDLHNLALLYDTQGRYADAETLYTHAIFIDIKALGPYHPSVATDLIALAGVFVSQARYGQAEVLLKAALKIFEKSLGPDHPDVATALNNLALLYQDQGRYKEAEPLLQRALSISEKALGPDHPNVAANLTSLAGVYSDEGRYAEAEPLLKRALAIDEKALGPQNESVASVLSLLGAIYDSENRPDLSEPIYVRALSILIKAFGPDHPRVAASLSNLGLVMKREGHYDKAEPIFKRAIAINEKALGPDHPDLAVSLINLALLYEAEGRFADAAPLFERALEIIHKRFQYGFAYMSEKDRLLFLATIQNVFPGYFSFSLAEHEHDPEAAARMYDVLLWEKGLVGTSVAALRAQVVASGDTQALKLLDDLTAKKAEASKLATARPPGWQESQAALNEKANALEQQLARRVSSLNEKNILASATWQDVQKSLRADEAAVEYVRFQFHNGKAFTGASNYVALVLTPKSKLPVFVDLGDARKLESTPIAAYREAVGQTRGVAPELPAQPVQGAANASSTTAYDAFWKPLEPALGVSKRVYVSADGVLNQIPMGLFADSNGKLLLEKYDVRQVNSTKDLLRTPHQAASKSAVLLGNPKFDLTEADQRAVLAKLNIGNAQPSAAPANTLASALAPSAGPAMSGQRSRDVRGGSLNPLPGTQVEVDAINNLLKNSGWQTTPYTGDRALEEVVDHLHSPRLVHVATHGFFLSDQEIARENANRDDRSVGFEDPMLRSGLYFAGADRVQSGAAPATGLDDGVLTAYEASQLNLQGTELVVLSACETGLGQQSNGEGVFGLRRGLQEAGADAVMMSMWSVPDRETQELMALFYAKWLGGLDKPEALRQAQLKEREVVRQRYNKDLPFYWGAFVLISR
jgi:CHAT domain-containing protein/Tfp pilus assembly protein PilF